MVVEGGSPNGALRCTIKYAECFLLCQDIVSDKIRNYADEPYFVKKAEKAKEFLRQHPIPERYLKK